MTDVVTPGGAILPSPEPAPRRRRVVRDVLRRPTGAFGAAVLLVLLIAALWPVDWLPFPPDAGDQSERFVRPWFAGGESAHPLGTDALGRDILSALIAGTRSTALIVFAAAAISLILGVVLGLLAGTGGKVVDAVIMRLVDIQLAFPTIVLVIAAVAAFGPSVSNLILILGLVGWAPYARLVRGQVLSLRRRPFVEAAQIGGVGPLRIMFRHLLPNMATSVIVFLTADLAGLVLIEASLSFLGLGVQPPDPSWGLMISEGRQYLYDAWWVVAVPGLAIVLTVLALNLLGDSVRDVLDPGTVRG